MSKKIAKNINQKLAIEKGIHSDLSYDLISSNIKLGEIISYKELCVRLNIPYYSSGNQKKSQIKELKRYFDYETINRKWLITEIYSSPLDKEARAVPSNSIYVKYVECILLRHLASQPKNEIYITDNKLWLLLGMINSKYNFYKDKYEDLETENELMTFFEVNNFYQRSHSYLSKIINNSLNSLERRVLIHYSKVYMIGRYVDDGKGVQHFEINEATVDEVEKILETKRNMLKEFGLETETQLMFKNIKFKREFYDTLDNAYEEIYGWTKVYKAYHIIYNSKNTLEALTQDQIQLSKLAINEKVINKINSQADVIAEEKGINSYTVQDMLLDGKEVKFTYPNVYVEVQKMLSDKLLKIK